LRGEDLEEGDVVVVGGGHAGVESALAAARLGCATILVTANYDTIGLMSCNPAIGGLAKGQLVREIDALGGQMGLATDEAMLQFRMLNTKKGLAVRSPRAQCDRRAYAAAIRCALEQQQNLEIVQGLVEEVLIRGGRVAGVVTREGARIRARRVVLAAGTFLKGRIWVGDVCYEGGRSGEPAAVRLSDYLQKVGFEVGRLKTGTPPRVDARSVDFERMMRQDGDEPPMPFSFLNDQLRIQQMPCWVTYTNARTHRIIADNLARSALYGGKIRATGVRYCPSIEDKVVKFAHKERHQVILEPEGRQTTELYVNGVSNSLPADIQERFLRTIAGLEEARITRFGYGIEYDFFPPTQLKPTLETKLVEGLFFAGQINGTTGYEEAAAQGIVAGINAALSLKGQEPLVLRRDQAYIGVLIDDLVTKGVDEPYRMFTSRAEFRLILRADNADLRLTPIAAKIGLASQQRIARLKRRKEQITQLQRLLEQQKDNGVPLVRLLRRQDVRLQNLAERHPQIASFPEDVRLCVEVEVKYEGFIKRMMRQVERLRELEGVRIPAGFDFWRVEGMKWEAREKLSRIRPATVGQAARVPGVGPSDVMALLIALRR